MSIICLSLKTTRKHYRLHRYTFYHFCAYALGKYCILPAGLQKLGSGPYGSNAVRYVIQALSQGRGVKIDRKSAQPGDIWCDHIADLHIGIVYGSNEGGAYKILSNSSSKASFSWLDTVEAYVRWYPSPNFQYWRVVS